MQNIPDVTIKAYIVATYVISEHLLYEIELSFVTCITQLLENVFHFIRNAYTAELMFLVHLHDHKSQANNYILRRKYFIYLMIKIHNIGRIKYKFRKADMALLYANITQKFCCWELSHYSVVLLEGAISFFYCTFTKLRSGLLS